MSSRYVPKTKHNTEIATFIHILTDLQHQCLQRQSAAWKDSLRFHQPRLGQMPGLRRVTLNLNTEVGDKGAKELADTLRDDVCLKGMSKILIYE